MKKLFIIPILFTFSFSQSKGNQVSYASYAIETTTANYNNVSLESVYGLGLKLYDRELNNKLNIPITEIKTLKPLLVTDRDLINLEFLRDLINVWL